MGKNEINRHHKNSYIQKMILLTFLVLHRWLMKYTVLWLHNTYILKKIKLNKSKLGQELRMSSFTLVLINAFKVEMIMSDDGSNPLQINHQ